MRRSESKSNYEIGPGRWFNRQEFLEQHPDWFRGFRLVTMEDVKPNAELVMVVVHTDHLDKPIESFTRTERIRFDKEPMRVIWDTDRDPNERYEDKPKGVSLIYIGGEQQTILLDYFLGEECEVSLIGHLAKIYLVRS